MICYILHQLPIWKKVPNGKRNVRIMILGLVLYILLHALAFEYKDSNLLFKTLNGYFFWFLVADIFACACLYRIYYGRSILRELDVYEKDKYDDQTHTYYQPEQEYHQQPVSEINSGSNKTTSFNSNDTIPVYDPSSNNLNTTEV